MGKNIMRRIKMKLATWNVDWHSFCLNKETLQEYVLEQSRYFMPARDKRNRPSRVGNGIWVIMVFFKFSDWKKDTQGHYHFHERKPLSVEYGIGIEEHDQEGRVITAEPVLFSDSVAYSR